jgi:hypothetical protein
MKPSTSQITQKGEPFRGHDVYSVKNFVRENLKSSGRQITRRISVFVKSSPLKRSGSPAARASA